MQTCNLVHLLSDSMIMQMISYMLTFGLSGICVCLLWNLVSVTAVWVVLKRDGNNVIQCMN